MRNPSTLLRTWVCEHVLRALLIYCLVAQKVVLGGSSRSREQPVVYAPRVEPHV